MYYIILFCQHIDGQIEINFAYLFFFLRLLRKTILWGQRLSNEVLHAHTHTHEYYTYDVVCVQVCVQATRKKFLGTGAAGRFRGGGASQKDNILPWGNVRRTRKTTLLGGQDELNPFGQQDHIYLSYTKARLSGFLRAFSFIRLLGLLISSVLLFESSNTFPRESIICLCTTRPWRTILQLLVFMTVG